MPDGKCECPSRKHRYCSRIYTKFKMRTNHKKDIPFQDGDEMFYLGAGAGELNQKLLHTMKMSV